MPESLSPFKWDRVFEYAVTELELPSPEERRRAITGSLERFEQMVGESQRTDAF